MTDVVNDAHMLDKLISKGERPGRIIIENNKVSWVTSGKELLFGIAKKECKRA